MIPMPILCITLLAALLHATLPVSLPAQGRDTIQVQDLRAVPDDIEAEVRAILGGPATRQARGMLVVGALDTIATDVAILDGSLVVEGLMLGRVVALGADVLIRDRGRIEGSVTVIGGGLTTQDDGEVDGTVRVYPQPVRIEQDGDRVVVRDESPDEVWYRHWIRPAPTTGSDLRLVTTRTYNRVEGLPLMLGPRVRLAFPWGRVTLDAMGVLRSADRFELQPENIGHQLRAEVEIGGPYSVRLGGQLEDLVKPAEGWHISDTEVGLASFILHRDYRDYYNRRAAAVSVGARAGKSISAQLEWSDEKWGSVDQRDPWSLLRDNQHWRFNPQMDDGRFHVVRAEVTYDTRNDQRDPWSGWFVSADYEYGTGRISAYAPTTQGIREVNPAGRNNYDRVFLDIRRYDRLSADGQLALRLVTGGWLSGDDLPLQRRFSLGSAGSLPGYDFRQILPGVDGLTCAGTGDGGIPLSPRSPPGTPAQCERFMLWQAEYRGELRSSLFGFLTAERQRRRLGWGRQAEWVMFVDAGRGWLVGAPVAGLQYGAGTLPPLSTFRADVGLGLRLDDLGLFVAKAVTDPGTPLNFFIRLRPRF